MSNKDLAETLTEEKTRCFKERFENFIHETSVDINKQLYGYQRTRERLLVKLSVLEKAEAILKKEQEKIKESLLALVGFDIKEDAPPYKERIVEIDDSTIAYKCTDESIPASY